MRRFLVLLISLIIIFSLLFFAIRDKIKINHIIENIKKNTGINIELQDKQKLTYFPQIIYENSLSITNKKGNLFVKNSDINIIKNYNINTPFLINFKSPSIIYQGINFENSLIESSYDKKVIQINKFTANLINGNINVKGYLSLNNKKDFSLRGSYKNISLNEILKQLNIAKWQRVKIKLSSPDFEINSINGTSKQIIENLNGKIDILGSIFFVSSKEERFGAAFLSLLADKIKRMISLSKSINYLLDKFADVPSDISGTIYINNGILKTEKLLINNKKAKALLSASLNLTTNLINGKIDLYENNIIFLTVELKGNINNPEILIDEIGFSKNGNTKSKNIKQIFEEGIQSLINDMLKINE